VFLLPSISLGKFGRMHHLSDKNGAIIALAPKETSFQAFRGIVDRNKSILKFLWNFNTSIDNSTNPDIVIFHENEISVEVKQKVQNETPEMFLTFTQIDNFNNNAIYENETIKTVYPHCTGTYISGTFKIGYKNMCRFWTIGFLKYVKNYDWIFRLDDDCEIEEEARNKLPPDSYSKHDKHPIFIASPAWLPLHRQKYDRITTTSEGGVVTGLGSFVREFSNKFNLNNTFIDSFYAPYTNAFYMNLKWLNFEKSKTNSIVNSYENSKETSSFFSNKKVQISMHEMQAAIVKQFIIEVDQSNCIYSNRFFFFLLLLFIVYLLLFNSFLIMTVLF
jgi:hypothetical protein